MCYVFAKLDLKYVDFAIICSSFKDPLSYYIPYVEVKFKDSNHSEKKSISSLCFVHNKIKQKSNTIPSH